MIIEKNNLIYREKDDNPYCWLTGVTNQNIEEAIINKNTKIIAGGAFYGCINLKSIEIPNSVTNIANVAFMWCSSLTSIIISDSVTKIGEDAFKHCPNLTIYCEAKQKPEDWDENWNPDNCPVVWGYKND